MADGMTFKENIENEKRKWSQMDKGQKWDYFKTYYFLPTLIIAGVIIALIYLILQCFVFRKDIVMSGFVYNLEVSDAGIQTFQEEYLDYIAGNPKKQEVCLGSSYVSKENYNEIMAIQARVGAETIDFLILDENAYTLLNEQSFYGNLDNILDKDILEALGDKIVTIADMDTGIQYNSAIDISNTEFAKQYLTGEKAYLVFVLSGKHLDDANKLVKYLMEE